MDRKGRNDSVNAALQAIAVRSSTSVGANRQPEEQELIKLRQVAGREVNLLLLEDL